MTATSSYHHGDLPAALLAAVDAIVREGDVGAVTLRAAARRTGVSHAAPAHHFGDKAGLLTAYAAQGFAALQARLVEAEQRATAEGIPALLALGLAYVRFAVEHPGHFAVMFRTELIDQERHGFRAVCDGAFEILLDAVRAAHADLDPEDPVILRAAAGAWSIVHGFATLWLGGNLPEAVTREPLEDAVAGALLGFGAVQQSADAQRSGHTDTPAPSAARRPAGSRPAILPP